MTLLNKSTFLILLAVIIVLVVWRNTKHSFIKTLGTKNRLEYALQLAGNNRIEFEKVLSYYKNDSLKYRAAVFLIENMPDYASEEWGTFRQGEKDTAFSLKTFKNRSKAIRVMDSLHISFSLIAIKPDKHEIKSAFLINNIDKAFGLWNQPWARHLTFNDFCEYLLPYRVGREKLEDFRAYIGSLYHSLSLEARKCSSALDAACIVNSRLLKDIRWSSQMALYPGRFNSSEMDQVKIGDCNQLSDYGLMVYRSFGFPIANDFVTSWGDTNGGHSWTVLELDNIEVPFVACDVQPGEFSFWFRPSKIWRRTFAIQKSELVQHKSDRQSIPLELDNQHALDVTDKYFKTIDIDINLTNAVPAGDNCAFLCVYNSDKWIPVDWGKISNSQKKMRLENINDSLLYCAMYYHEKELKPASRPFFISGNSIVQYFITDKKELFNFKYPIHSKNLNQQYNLFVWDDKWKKIISVSPISDGVNNFLQFMNVPARGLYKVNDGTRPFWFMNEKLTRSEPGVPLSLKRLKKYR